MSTLEVTRPVPVRQDVGSSFRRLLSIDLFRGILVAGMILVTNPGTYSSVYAPLKHAEWNGWTLTDMIFPSFLFLVGVSVNFSFTSRQTRGQTSPQIARHIALRSLGLIILGLLLNLFDLLQLEHWRLPGVLQRIGLCYCAGGLLNLALLKSPRLKRCFVLAAIIVLLVSAYWLMQTQIPLPGYGKGNLNPAGTFSAYLDRAVFTTNHLWHWGGPGQMWDPEGLLSTLPALANLLLGIIAGDWLLSANSKSTKVLGMTLFGAGLIGLAIALNPIIPINKKIWTPSFVLLSGGCSFITFALLHWLVDTSRIAENRLARAALAPALIYGSNAILGFALANAISPLLGVIHLNGEQRKPITIPQLTFEWFSHFLAPLNASLAYAVVFVLLIMAILYPLYRMRIFVRF